MHADTLPTKCACGWTHTMGEPGWVLTKPHPGCLYHLKGKKVKLSLQIESDNDAVQHPDELSRILEYVAANIRSGRGGGWVRDINGNRVGFWSLETEDLKEGNESETDTPATGRSAGSGRYGQHDPA